MSEIKAKLGAAIPAADAELKPTSGDGKKKGEGKGKKKKKTEE